MRYSRIVLALLLAFMGTQAHAADLWRAKGSPSFIDPNGKPYANGKLCYYDAGTADQKTVYKDAAEATPWTQPITLNAAGALDDPIFMPTGSFKEVFLSSDDTDCSDGTTLYTSDDLPGALDIASLGLDYAKPQQPSLAKASDYTVQTTDLGGIINCDTTAGSVTLTLPNAADAGSGGQIGARKTSSDANTCTLATVGSQNINGSSTWILSQQYQAVSIVSDGANWGTQQGIVDGQVSFAKLSSNVYDTDGTLAGNSDSKLPTQKAVKTYVDTAAASGVKWKDPVRVATTTSGTLASSFENGDTVDGVTLATNDRILVKDQASKTENGLYKVNASGAPTRTTDADSGTEVVGATVYVTAGTSNIGTQWTNTNTTAPTLGTDDITFSEIAAANTYTADGSTLQLSGQQFSIKDGGVGATQIASGAVGSSQIASNAVTSGKLSSTVANSLHVAGEVIAFTGTSCPSGSLEANGSNISRTTYSALFSATGTRYGTGDGSTTFALPDYCGYFLRGWDHGIGHDPDASSRTNSGNGTTGDNVGTKQADQYKSHSHDHGSLSGSTGTVVQSGNTGSRGTTNPSSDTITSLSSGSVSVNISGSTGSSGGNETRPVNVNILYCVFTGV